MLSYEKFKSMNESDRNNKRRIIRAIEVGDKKGKTNDIKYNNLVIGLYCDRAQLKERIDIRVAKRIEQGGIDEAKSLFENYEKLAPQVKDANGYKQLFSYLKKETTLDEAIYRWKVSEYKHAKNQMTWFKKYGNVIWFDITSKNNKVNIEKKVYDFLQ
jgi:tRNA dimethylallyltransferase